jgi:hypothetical protein
VGGRRVWIIPITFSVPRQKPKPSTPEAKEIAGEVLSVVRNCAQEQHAYRHETEIALGEIFGLLDYLEIISLRGVAKGGSNERHRSKTGERLPVGPAKPNEKLSLKRIVIVELVAAGKNNKEIAAYFGMAINSLGITSLTSTLRLAFTTV